MSEFYPSPHGNPSSAREMKFKPPYKSCGCLFLIAALISGVGLWDFLSIPGKVRKKEAMIMALGIADAIKEFQSAYGTLPLPSTIAQPGSDTLTDTSAAHAFVSMLLGEEPPSSSPQNPWKSDFLEGIKPARSILTKEATTVWKNGIYLDPSTGHHSIVDPWVNPYQIRIDTNHDNEIENPNIDQVSAGRPLLPHRVLVWSPGKDGKEETWDDNPMSWE
jgi:hypothetical protein